jgi:hypothetical protein
MISIIGITIDSALRQFVRKSCCARGLEYRRDIPFPSMRVVLIPSRVSLNLEHPPMEHHLVFPVRLQPVSRQALWGLLSRLHLLWGLLSHWTPYSEHHQIWKKYLHLLANSNLISGKHATTDDSFTKAVPLTIVRHVSPLARAYMGVTLLLRISKLYNGRRYQLTSSKQSASAL